MKRTALLVTAGLALALAGCGKKTSDSAAKAAGGEVLPGTVSDAMIDTDRSQAEAPLLAVKPSGGAKEAKGTAPTDAASETAPATDTAPDAGASPAPEPAPKPSASAKPAAKPTAAPKP